MVAQGFKGSECYKFSERTPLLPLCRFDLLNQRYLFIYLWMSVRSNNCISCGFESRPGNCPFTPVAQGSGAVVTWGRKFPIGKAAGRNADEPTCSLVNKSRRCRPSGRMGKANACWHRQRKRSARSSGVAGAACGRRYAVQCWRPSTVVVEDRQPACIRPG